MRCITKLDEPDILKVNNQQWLQDYVSDQSNSYKKYKYRHADIKLRLKEETGYKCVYCESKIGHNTPGDIEHKVPSSKFIERHFDWINLTIACTECNRRKNDYYILGDEFIDPYVDDVEFLIEHHGPLVYWKSSNNRAEVSVRLLDLNDLTRQQLIERKISKIEEFNNLIERFLIQSNQALKGLLWKQVEEMTNKNAEYSSMLQSVIEAKGITSSSTGSA